MKTYSGPNAGSVIIPVLENAQEYLWIISPWLGKEYAKRLSHLSQKGVEVRIITSNVDYNIESLEIFKASENPNLNLLVLDKGRSDDEPNFIHSKIYLVDNKYGISGSANLTYSGLNSNVESLNIAQTKDEIQHIETDFMKLWMKYENKRMSKEELSGTSYSVKKALPLLINYGNLEKSKVRSLELVYHPYYFFDFIFRGSVRSPPLMFEDAGVIMLDTVTSQITNDTQLTQEINQYSKTDYIVKTENKYQIKIHQPTVGDFHEARELVLDKIITRNTRHYEQHYRNRSYDRLFVPR
ncbi:MAG: Cardiolipin synthase [Thermoproteota archaeon]|nr:Cardiolipin synthase [Thermoproteota archaeon]